MTTLRTWKRSKRRPKHLAAREQRLLLLYDQALLREAWRTKEDQWQQPSVTNNPATGPVARARRP